MPTTTSPTAQRKKPGPKGPLPHAFKKGQPKPPGSGRKLGQKNKFSRDIKEGLLTAYEQLGGPAFFLKLGRSRDDRKTLATLLGKLLPTQITGANGGPVSVETMQRAQLAIKTLSPAELEQLKGLFGKMGVSVLAPGEGGQVEDSGALPAP